MWILGSSESAVNKDMSKKWTIGIKLSDWVENIVGKGEIARYQQFLLFSTIISKAVFCWCEKKSIYRVKG